MEIVVHRTGGSTCKCKWEICASDFETEQGREAGAAEAWSCFLLGAGGAKAHVSKQRDPKDSDLGPSRQGGLEANEGVHEVRGLQPLLASG